MGHGLVWSLPVPVTAVMSVAVLVAAAPTVSLLARAVTLLLALLGAAAVLTAFRRWWAGPAVLTLREPDEDEHAEHTVTSPPADGTNQAAPHHLRA